MRLLTDDDYFADLQRLEEAQEDELIEQYVNGELSGREREKFTRVFLSTPERQEKLNLVRDLSAYAASTAASTEAPRDVVGRKKKPGGWFSSLLAFFNFRSPLLTASLAAAIVLVALGGAWLFFKVRGLEAEVSRLRAGQPATPSPTPAPGQDAQQQLAELRARNEELSAALRHAEEERGRLGQEIASLKSQEARPSPPTAPPTQRGPVLSLVLPLIQGRSGDSGARELKLPPGPARVQLLLDMDVIDPREYKSYRVVIKRRDGTVAWSDNRPRLQIRGGENRLAVNIPAERLPEGEYLAELSGVSRGAREVIGVYTFRSSKQ